MKKVAVNSFEQKQLTKWWLKKIEESWRFRTLNWQAPFTTKQMRKWLYFIWLVYQGVAVKTISNIPSKLYPFFFKFSFFFFLVFEMEKRWLTQSCEFYTEKSHVYCVYKWPYLCTCCPKLLNRGRIIVTLQYINASIASML